ncbi:hypothetical protein Pint_17075 [Pistacia integerrima]|uniref:Uncharacterized protein n=1 Tax=Pistacia integerrima TaxID=434235 RepID=A0ACC0ZCC2_9ROSI|nr:hypothetical protein Pint_17075 [Pistacia integerrima]
MSATRLFLFTTFSLLTRNHKPHTLIPPRFLAQRFNFSSLRFCRYSSSVAVDGVTGYDTDSAKLSETAPDPLLPRPAPNPVQQKKQVKFAEDELLQDVEMKRGDWMCPKIDMNLTVSRGKIRPLTAHVLKPRRDTKGTKMSRGCSKLNIGFLCLDVLEDFVLRKVLGFQVQAWRAFAAVLTLLCLSYFIAVLIFLRCNFLNFARNVTCLKCTEYVPKSVRGSDVQMKEGDWICSECNFMNFSRNTRCLKCKAGGPKGLAVDEFEVRKDDWNCPLCLFVNFARNKNCLRCREQRPKRLLNYGEWECPSCDYLNYSRNEVCRKCKSVRPKEDATAALASTTTSASVATTIHRRFLSRGGISGNCGSYGHRSAGAVSLGFAGALAAVASLSFQEVYAKEPPPADLVPKDVVLYQFVSFFAL